jgi:hypothetical protein
LPGYGGSQAREKWFREMTVLGDFSLQVERVGWYCFRKDGGNRG